MGITHIPQQVASTVQDASRPPEVPGKPSPRPGLGQELGAHRGRRVAGDRSRLLATGKRKAGLAVAAAGTIFALVEDPEGVKKVWNNIPDYLDSGHSMLTRFEKFVGELTSQGEKLRSVVEKVVRQ